MMMSQEEETQRAVWTWSLYCFCTNKNIKELQQLLLHTREGYSICNTGSQTVTIKPHGHSVSAKNAIKSIIKAIFNSISGKGKLTLLRKAVKNMKKANFRLLIECLNCTIKTNCWRSFLIHEKTICFIFPVKFLSGFFPTLARKRNLVCDGLTGQHRIFLYSHFAPNLSLFHRGQCANVVKAIPQSTMKTWSPFAFGKWSQFH